MTEMKNICGKIPVELHEKVRAEIEEKETSTQIFIRQVIEEHFNRLEGKGEESMEKRTLAVQVTEELFQRVKWVVAKEGIKQKDFIIRIIEKAVEEVEAKWQELEQPEETPEANRMEESTEETAEEEITEEGIEEREIAEEEPDDESLEASTGPDEEETDQELPEDTDEEEELPESEEETEEINSKDFGVPQSRKRVYLVGYLDRRCAGKILPFPAANGTSLVQVQTGRQGERIYKAEGLSCTLTSGAGGVGGKTGLYEVGVPIKENTKQGYKMAYTGDSIDLGYAGMNTRRGRVGHQIAHTLTTGIQQGTLHFVDLSPPPLVTEHCRCLNTRQSGIHNHKGECSGVLKEEGARAVLTPGREEIRQNGRRMKEPEEPMFTITATDRHGVAYRGRIRKLVPRECLRLQGFYDWQIDRIEQDTSDSQLYKQAGNGVTVNVIEAIGTLLRQVDEEIRAEDEKTKR